MLSLDRHAIAVISIVGSGLDVLGALYLAYDLLGGEHGPLRTLTRGVTYGVLFGVGYGIGLGPAFGIAAGIAHGLTLAWEFSRASRNQGEGGPWRDATASLLRGVGFGVGLGWRFGVGFGAIFTALSTLGQIVAYRVGIRPTADYHPQTRPRITRLSVMSALNRTVGYAAAAWISASVSIYPAEVLPLVLRTGLTLGLVTAVFSTFAPMVEWMADHVPEKRMAVFGLALILCGFCLQSVQYWVVVLDVPLR